VDKEKLERQIEEVESNVRYWFFENNGGICNLEFFPIGDHAYNKKIGNCYKTLEIARNKI